MKKSDTEPKNTPERKENHAPVQNQNGALDKEFEKLDEESRREEQYYEQRRRERHERILKRKKRQIRNRNLALIITALLILCGLGYFFGDRIGLDGKVSTLVSQVKGLLPQGKSGDTEADVTPAENEKGNTASGETVKQEISGDGSGTENDAPGDDAQTIPTASADTSDMLPQAASAGAGILRRQIRHEKKVLTTAKEKAVQYDYDGAINLLQNDNAYVRNVHFQKAAEKFQKKKDKCVAWSPASVTHIFYHSLIVDTSKAFDGDYKTDGYNQVMTTMEEFNKITQIMYDKGYVMVNLYDLAGVDADGNMKAKQIYLPKGKTPFVLSQDDVCYYHSQDGDGIATRLVVDEEGKVRNEYVQDDGSTVVGDYDVVPLIDRFVEEHPDFAYHGHKGIVALTGYNGILGYRTDISYQTRPDDLNDDKKAWLDAHPDFDLDTERAGAKKVADAMKTEG